MLLKIVFFILQNILAGMFCYEQFKYNASIYGHDIWAQGIFIKVFDDSALFVLPCLFCSFFSFIIAPIKLPWIKSLFLFCSESYLILNGGSYLGFNVLIFYLFNIIVIVAMLIDCFVNFTRVLKAKNLF